MKAAPVLKCAAGILTAAFLSACAGPDLPEPPIAGRETEPLQKTGMITTPRIKTTHIEDSSYALHHTFSFYHHARVAAEITRWGQHHKMDTRVIDTNPFILSPAVREAAENSDFISISSITYRNLENFDSDVLNDLWARSRAIVVQAAGNDSNSLCDARWSPNARESIESESYSPYTRGDTVLRIGAATGDQIACYSSENSPDMVYYTAFEQGFCSRYYMTQEEIDSFLSRYGGQVEHWRSALGDETFTAHPEAYTQTCTLGGTSFSAPNMVNRLGAMAHKYPQLHEYELMATALLATTPLDPAHTRSGQRAAQNLVTTNSRGLVFDTITGFGLYDPDLHDEKIQDLLRLKAADPALATRPVLHDTQDFIAAGSRDGLQSFSMSIDDPGTILRSIVEIRFNHIPGMAHFFDQEFPKDIYIQSPAGTKLRLTPVDDKMSIDGTTGYRLTADATAFLGEEAQGQWTISLPRKQDGSAHEVVSMRLSHWSMAPGNPVDELLDQSPPAVRAVPVPAYQPPAL